MSFGSNALIRFLETAAERLTELGEQISQLAESPSDSQIVKRIKRDLHTFKGEARLLELSEIERLAHAGEDLLFAHSQAGQVGEETAAFLYEALDAMFACVQARADEQEPPKELAEEVVASLRTALEAMPQTQTEPAAAVSTASQPTEAAPQQAARAAESDVDSAPSEGEAQEQGRPERGSKARGQYVSEELLRTITNLVSTLSGSLVRNRQLITELNATSLPFREQHSRDAEKLEELVRELREHQFRMDVVFGELSEHVRESRLQSLRSLFVSYPTFARQTAKAEGKQVRVEIEGDDLMVDQEVLRVLSEPSIHLLRNAIVHGLESPEDRRQVGKDPTGRIRIVARQDGEFVRLEFTDDGRGIDADRVARAALAKGRVSEEQLAGMTESERLKLIFLSGLSTAEQTTELAGRGVGLDVVESVLQQMGGAVDLETQLGHYTRFILQAPTSLSLTRVMLVEAGDQLLALPSSAVSEVFRISVKDIDNLEGREVLRHREQTVPLLRLRQTLGFKGIQDVFANKLGVVLLKVGNDVGGFIVDRFLGEREIVSRPLGPILGRVQMVSGVTIMEGGEVVLVLHPADLLRASQEGGSQKSVDTHAAATTRQTGRKILYAEDSLVTREYSAGVLRAYGYEVVEAEDGQQAWETLQNDRFDLLLTDLQMPNLDGFKLTAQVRKSSAFRNLPIVVMSTLDTPEVKRMALDAGADSYLVKSSFSADALLQAIERVIR